MKYQRKEIPLEISTKCHMKSIVNSVEFLMKYQWTSVGNPVEIPIEIHLKFQWNAIQNCNEMPVEIPMAY